jgi:exodeoxyribonuclease VII large subunit
VQAIDYQYDFRMFMERSNRCKPLTPRRNLFQILPIPCLIPADIAVTKSNKSQWDFGELFPAEQLRKVLSVTELTGQIRALLEKQIGQIWVSGEITNFRLQSSGHMYFTLKDVAAQLSCVLFSRERITHRDLLADGQKVLLQGEITVYETRGQYQLIVRAVELQGIGALQLAFEKLKQKLAAEGLFATERKRTLPPYPQRIGLVTSPTGAAIRDVLHVIQRRNPSLQIILVPCRVQGDGAAREVAAAIRLLNEFSSRPDTASAPLDLILLTRGGGSLEDLWAFNEEIVARAIFESQLPVVSAIGHEIDFTIADFVADLRAATPSAAAEIITEGVFACREFIGVAQLRLRQLFQRSWERKLDQIESLAGRFTRLHPRRRLDQSLQRLDDYRTSLLRRLKVGARQRQLQWENLAARLARRHPRPAFQLRQERLLQLQKRLNLLGPQQVLARGYSITTDQKTGKVLRNAAQTRDGQKIRVRLQHGELTSRIEK